MEEFLKEFEEMKWDIETVLAFLESCLRTGKPTLREIILYMKRKMEMDEAMKLPIIDEKENKK